MRGVWLDSRRLHMFGCRYQWPHILYYDTPEQLIERIDTLLRNASLRREISAAQKAFFARERGRTEGHVRGALRRALEGARALF